MKRLHGSYSAAPSKASPHTLCQKCLKRDKYSLCQKPNLVLTSHERHYSYECKSTAQDRPYASRPSRTQQLSNPRLLPKLSSDVPNELLRKKGIADEELANKEAERKNKRKMEDGYTNGSRKRSRSISSYTTVSSISTSKSCSMGTGVADKVHTGQSQLMSGLEVTGSQRSLSSAMSYTSDDEHDEEDHDESNNRKGYRYSRTPVGRRDTEALREHNGNQRRRPAQNRRSRSMSYSSDSSYDRSCRKRSSRRDGGKRRRRASKSPDDRGRERDFEGRRNSRRACVSSESRDRSQVTKHRKSMTPGLPSKTFGAIRPDALFSRKGSYENDHDRYGGSTRVGEENFAPKRATVPPRKERSLSPFSKRLALTQAMNTG